MKQHIRQLAAIARKRRRRIIGLMSGTSLDGLDVALCAFSGAGQRTRVKVERFKTVPYDGHFKAEIRRVFAQKEIDFQHLVLLNALVAERHASIVNQCLLEWGVAASEVDLVASHGQTVFHAPRVLHGLPDYPNATLQIGDGDHIARRTGIVTISDFRQKHLAAGGEGAPLALYGDYYLFSKNGEERFLLNIGGIANFTYLPADGNPTKAFATDTGPGNTLLDAFARALFDVPFDEEALLAKAGRVDERLLDIFKAEPFFAKPLPKTTGPELFSTRWVEAAVRQLPKGNPNPYDLFATLTRLTSDTIADALNSVAHQHEPSLYLSGGGAHNPLIVQYLKNNFRGWKIRPMRVLGVDGDAKEAVLFAVLANESVAGEAMEGAVLGGVPLVGMGKISLPG
ncbi:MAG: anhydro-N-acetylmuramic acid kinase [Saprospiraceae bacterium]|nr:anhydro-N-acetylmuramic acid kinase [Saprospiraceae bacterium]